MSSTLLHTFKTLFFPGILLFFSCNPSPRIQTDTNQYQFKENLDLVDFVGEAAMLFSEKGMDAIREFGEKNSKWYSGTKYIFIYDQSGVCVFHPILRGAVGKNLLEIKDMNGKPIGHLIQSIASDPHKPYGWIHYLWAEPGEIFPAWKNAYIMGVKGHDGRTYAIGSGTYIFRTEIKFVSDIVDSAAKLIRKQGKACYDQLLDKSSIFYFYNTYIFVLSTDGQLLADPSFPTNIGRNAIDFKDYNGHFVIKEMLERLKKEDAVYISYLWPAPGQATPSKKMIYARKTLSEGETVIVGSSLYLMEPIWKKF